LREPTETAALGTATVEGLTASPTALRAGPVARRAPAVPAVADGIRSVGPVAILYVGLVLLLWLPFGPRDGMGYETSFPYTSETSSFWHGFLYTADPLRIYTNFFYNLGYHLSAWIGESGSFVGFQIVYAALWWGRGVLVYLIMRILFPRHQVLAALTGLLVLVQASDHALNWVGQMNQFGTIFWMVLAFYALVRALNTPSSVGVAIAAILAALFAYMSLWSYESPLFMILAFPVIVLALRFGWSRRTLLISAVFYVPPLVYAWDNLRRYTSSGSSALYQESVERSSFGVGALLHDLWFNVWSALKFTAWGSQMPAVTAGTERIFLGFGGAIVAASGVAVVGYGALRRGEPIVPERRPLLVALAAGLILLVLSFPAYLVLADADSLWRTQFLAGIGAALVLVAVAGLLALRARRRTLQLAVLAVTAGLVSYFGVYASFTMASFHYSNWQRTRTAMAEVVGFVPRLKPDSLVVLTGVPKGSGDPFGDNMWFDMSLRLAYPHDPVVGIYYYSDGTPAPHENMVLQSQQWSFNGTGFPTLLTSVPVANTVVIQYSASGLGHVEAQIPRFLSHQDPWLAATYDPLARIEAGPAPALVRRRYGPIPQD
jgi:hypothetical protein